MGVHFFQISETASRLLQILTIPPTSTNTSTPFFPLTPLKRLSHTVPNTGFSFIESLGRPPYLLICSQKFPQVFCGAVRFILQNRNLHPNSDIQHVGKFLVISLPWHHPKYLHNYSPNPLHCISDGWLLIQPQQNESEASRDAQELQFDSVVGVENLHMHSRLLPNWHANSKASLRHNLWR